MATQGQSDGMEGGPRPFRFDFADYERMDEAGMFADREGRVELIEGMIVEMAPPGGDHTDVTSDPHLSLGMAVKTSRALGPKVLTQGTPRIGEHSAPEPDVFVARSREGRKYYQAAYAVPETRSVRVYRGPLPEGQWDSEATVTEPTLGPLFAPTIAIVLAEVFSAS